MCRWRRCVFAANGRLCIEQQNSATAICGVVLQAQALEAEAAELRSSAAQAQAAAAESIEQERLAADNLQLQHSKALASLRAELTAEKEAAVASTVADWQAQVEEQASEARQNVLEAAARQQQLEVQLAEQVRRTCGNKPSDRSVACPRQFPFSASRVL